MWNCYKKFEWIKHYSILYKKLFKLFYIKFRSYIKLHFLKQFLNVWAQHFQFQVAQVYGHTEANYVIFSKLCFFCKTINPSNDVWSIRKSFLLGYTRNSSVPLWILLPISMHLAAVTGGGDNQPSSQQDGAKIMAILSEGRTMAFKTLFFQWKHQKILKLMKKTENVAECRKNPKADTLTQGFTNKDSSRESSNRRPSVWEAPNLTYRQRTQTGGVNKNSVEKWTIRIYYVVIRKKLVTEIVVHIFLKCSNYKTCMLPVKFFMNFSLKALSGKNGYWLFATRLWYETVWWQLMNARFLSMRSHCWKNATFGYSLSLIQILAQLVLLRTAFKPQAEYLFLASSYRSIHSVLWQSLKSPLKAIRTSGSTTLREGKLLLELIYRDEFKQWGLGITSKGDILDIFCVHSGLPKMYLTEFEFPCAMA